MKRAAVRFHRTGFSGMPVRQGRRRDRGPRPPLRQNALGEVGDPGDVLILADEDLPVGCLLTATLLGVQRCVARRTGCLPVIAVSRFPDGTTCRARSGSPCRPRGSARAQQCCTGMEQAARHPHDQSCELLVLLRRQPERHHSHRRIASIPGARRQRHQCAQRRADGGGREQAQRGEPAIRRLRGTLSRLARRTREKTYEGNIHRAEGRCRALGRGGLLYGQAWRQMGGTRHGPFQKTYRSRRPHRQRGMGRGRGKDDPSRGGSTAVADQGWSLT